MTATSDLSKVDDSANVDESVANFLTVTLPPGGPTAAQVVNEFRRHGVYLRDLSPMSTAYQGRMIRIAVKDTEDNARIVAIMADAVVVPGKMFGPAAGMLMYASVVAERRGATLHRHYWSQEPPNPFEPEIEGWVRDEVTPLLDTVGGNPLIIAKSLGTTAAVLAAERVLPAVWLTPVLTVPWVPAALSRATAPFLIVGGTADSLWDSALAHRLSPYVLEIEGADHGMYLPGPLTDSMVALRRIVVAVEEFLDDIHWPTSPA